MVIPPRSQPHRDYFYVQILRQAELHLQHNVQECRSRRNGGNRWLFRRGMEQGIDCGLNFYFDSAPLGAHDARPLAQRLFDHKKEVIEVCALTPYRAVRNWGLTELADMLDVEREAVVCGLQHGLGAVAQNLPRLLRDVQNKKASRRKPSVIMAKP